MRIFKGLPDVAAEADLFKIFLSETPILIGGTSAASPAFAGFVSLLNDARLKAGLPSLGFLNPLIYAISESAPTAFNDITIGNNPGCGTNGFNVSCLTLFLALAHVCVQATKGWDPVTGLGTPNFGKLKDIVTGHHIPGF